jgi:hypothetical protein
VKKPAQSPKPKLPTSTDYAELARSRLRSEVTVHIVARGKQDLRIKGVLLAYLPAGTALLGSDIQTVRVPDLVHFAGMPEQTKKRLKAAVCIVRVTDAGSGEVRFLTPRVQQVEW